MLNKFLILQLIIISSWTRPKQLHKPFLALATICNIINAFLPSLSQSAIVLRWPNIIDRTLKSKNWLKWPFGFFLTYEDLGRMFDHSFPVCAFFSFFLKWRLAHTHKFHSSGQDQSTVAQPAEMTVAMCFLTSCKWAHFQIGSHTMPGQWHSQPILTSLGQGCMHVYV